MSIAEIEGILFAVELIRLNREQFPRGRVLTSEDNMYARQAEIEMVAPKIVEAYKLVKGSEGVQAEFLDRIFYLARNIMTTRPWGTPGSTEERIDDQDLSERLRAIADEGRQVSWYNNSLTIDNRIKIGRLYADNTDTFAAQLKDPKRGCSASVCTNCDEPNAYCYVVCDVCDYEMIGAHGMPTVEEWRKMEDHKKVQSLHKGYGLMVKGISERGGDWRGDDSPLNRLAKVE